MWKTAGIGLKENTTWETYMEKATSDGYQTILSAPWYLNIIKYGSDWYDYYKIEPYAFNGTADQKKLVIGGNFKIKILENIGTLLSKKI
jgi:hypothetical protein